MRLAVVGTGLIGGSFALAARHAGLFDEIIGVEPGPERARRALAVGLVDRLVDSVPEGVDAVLLAGPVDTLADWVVRLAEHPGILFDVGSVKAAVIDRVRAACPSGLPVRFIPCHPLAGSEKSGPDAADAELFRGAEVIVTPAAETDATALEQVACWWRAIGARMLSMTADDHDRVLAVTSHLPHLLAFAYLQQVSDEHLSHAAGGFRDFTRIGAADPHMWAPILQLNRRHLMSALDDLEGSLASLRVLLAGDDGAALEAFIRAAGARRGRPEDA